MFLEELEVRLETDPLLPGGLIDLIDDVMDSCECRAHISVAAIRNVSAMAHISVAVMPAVVVTAFTGVK